MKAGFHLAADVVRSSFEGRAILLVIVSLVGFFGLLLVTLDLQVVQGSLAAFRLFGLVESPDGAWDYLNAQLGGFVHVVVLGFGIVAGSGAAPALLAPGRVEAMLALPVSRVELVLGTYFGVLALASAAGVVAAGGIAGILWWKIGLVPLIPAVGALSAVIGFAAVYAVMLLAATLIRSAPLGVGVGLIFWLIATLSSGREHFAALFEDAWAARAFELAVAPIPPLAHLFMAATAVEVEPELRVDALFASFGCAAFAAAVLLVAIWVINGRDY